MKNKLIKTLFLMLCLSVYATGYAQLAKWAIAPKYDKISFKLDDKIIQTDSAGWTSLWTIDGKKIFSTQDVILDFNDGAAVIVKKGTDKIVGCIDEDGRFVALPNLGIAFGDPYFHNGMLTYDMGEKKGYYSLVSNQIIDPVTPYNYPYSHGYAPFMTYANPEKMKNPYYGYRNTDNVYFDLSIRDNKGQLKVIEPKDVSFVSGIRYDGKGIVVYKNKIYLVDSDSSTGELMPLYYKNIEDKKSHLSVDTKVSGGLIEDYDGTLSLFAVDGNKNRAQIKFAPDLKPISMEYTDDKIEFKAPQKRPTKYESDLSPFSARNAKSKTVNGLKNSKGTVVPAQFDAVDICFGNRAFVQLDGKWGVVEVLPDEDMLLTLNSGDDVPFRHYKFKTQIRIDTPADFSTEELFIDVPETSGLRIDIPSRRQNDTRRGNYLTYDCEITIPPTLPDTLTKVTYQPVLIENDGLQLLDQKVTVNAWHYRSYAIDIWDIEAERDSVTFMMTISMDRPSEDMDYPFEVKIEGDSLVVQNEIKINEMRRKYVIANVKPGENAFNVLLTEKGCPTIVYPFEISIQAPEPQEKEKKGGKSPQSSGKKKAVVNKKPATKKKNLTIPLDQF